MSAPGHPSWCEPRQCAASDRPGGMHRSAVVPVGTAPAGVSLSLTRHPGGLLSLVRLDLVGLDEVDQATGSAVALVTGPSALVLARDLSALAGWWSR